MEPEQPTKVTITQVEGTCRSRPIGMREWSNLSSDRKDEETKEIIENIAEHCKRLEEPDMERLIRCYDSQKTSNKIKKDMMRQSKDVTKEYLMKTIQMLDKDGNLTEYMNNKDRLLNKIILKIDILMPNKCNICDKWYAVDISHESQVKCYKCEIHIHDCIKVEGIKAMDKWGIKWLCSDCDENKDEESTEHLKEQAVRRNSQQHSRQENTGQEWSLRVDDNSHDIPILVGMPANDVESHTHREAEFPEDPSGNTETEGNNMTGTESTGEVKNGEGEGTRRKSKHITQTTETNRKQDEVEICRYYLKGKCWHEDNCYNKHPPLCSELVYYGVYHPQGCKKSQEECGYLHPEVCKHFERYQSCKWGNRCFYLHPLGLDRNGHEMNKRTNGNPQLTNRGRPTPDQPTTYQGTPQTRSYRGGRRFTGAQANMDFLGTETGVTNKERNFQTKMLEMMEAVMARIDAMEAATTYVRQIREETHTQ